jgi:hypothetical protein
MPAGWREHTGSSGQTSGRTAAVLACAITFVVAYLRTPPLFALDDAYISLHSARVLLSGHDASFLAPAMTGVTSPAYVALLVALLVLKLPALRVATALGVTAFVAGVWALGTTLQLSLTRRALLVVIVLGSGFAFLNATNGLETGWAFAALTWLIVFALRGAHFPAAAAAAVLPLLRPDLAPASALVLVYVLWGRAFKDWLGAIAIAAAVALPFVVWVRLDTGVWLPQTMRAKELWFSEACRPLLEKIRGANAALVDVGGQLFACAVGAFFLVRDRLGRLGIIAGAISVTAYVALLPNGLFHNYYRYPYAIVLPWAALGLAYAMRHQPASRITTIGFAMLAAWTLSRFPSWALDGSAITREMTAASAWLDANVPRDAVVLVHDAGAPSEFSHARLVDIVGLKTASSIEAHERWTFPACGAGRGHAIADIARQSGATYAMVLNQWDYIFRMTDGLRSEGFELVQLRKPPRRGPGYAVYRLDALP